MFAGSVIGANYGVYRQIKNDGEVVAGALYGGAFGAVVGLGLPYIIPVLCMTAPGYYIGKHERAVRSPSPKPVCEIK